MSEDRVTAAIRGVTKKEKNARRIEITCIEIPGSEDQYKVCVTPKEKTDAPGHVNRGMGPGYVNPFERLFEGNDAEARVLAYIKEIL